LANIKGIESIRLATNGAALPSTRVVSLIVFGTNDGKKPKPGPPVTLALMQFGQLINHDFQSSTTFTFGWKPFICNISLNQ
jgi:hypothetical protein